MLKAEFCRFRLYWNCREKMFLIGRGTFENLRVSALFPHNFQEWVFLNEHLYKYLSECVDYDHIGKIIAGRAHIVPHSLLVHMCTIILLNDRYIHTFIGIYTYVQFNQYRNYM